MGEFANKIAAEEEATKEAVLETPNISPEVQEVAGKVTEAFAQADTDNDGKLSKQEAQAVGLSDRTFENMDVNNDGVVDRVEASAAGISEQTFEKVDVNNDGELSKSEFVQAALPPVVEAARESTATNEDSAQKAAVDSTEAEVAQAAQEQAAMDAFEAMCFDAFEANRSLRDENERLRAELELLLALTTPESTPPATSRAAEPSS